MAVVTCFLQPPAQGFFLYGPRGTGKSTWLAQMFPLALRIDLLAPELLRAFCQLRRQGDSLSFWRTRSGLEVDFVVYGPDLFWAIEVKRSARIDKRDLTGLKAFGVDYPQAERVLLSFAPEPLLIDGIRCEPLEPWLRKLQPNHLNQPIH